MAVLDYDADRVHGIAPVPAERRVAIDGACGAEPQLVVEQRDGQNRYLIH